MGSRLSTVVTHPTSKSKFSHFSTTDLKKWESQFNTLHPTGHMTEKDLTAHLYRLFPFGQLNFSQHLFKTINISNSGEIDFNELLIAYSILKKGSIHEKLRWIFRLYDTDADGVISKEEMQNIVHGFLSMICCEEDSKEIVEGVFRECENESGLLSFEDFKALANARSAVVSMFFE